MRSMYDGITPAVLHPGSLPGAPLQLGPPLQIIQSGYHAVCYRIAEMANCLNKHYRKKLTKLFRIFNIFFYKNHFKKRNSQ